VLYYGTRAVGALLLYWCVRYFVQRPWYSSLGLLSAVMLWNYLAHPESVWHQSQQLENQFWMLMALVGSAANLFCPDSPYHVSHGRELLGDFLCRLVGVALVLGAVVLAHFVDKRHHRTRLKANVVLMGGYESGAEGSAVAEGKTARLELLVRQLDRTLPSALHTLWNVQKVLHIEREILEVFSGCSKEELNYVLFKSEMKLLAYKLKNHNKGGASGSLDLSAALYSQKNRSRSGLMEILCVRRVSDLNLAARAVVLDIIQGLRMTLHPDTEREAQEWVANLLLTVKGDELSDLKQLVDNKGSAESMHKLIYVDITSAALRARILEHFKKQASIQAAQLAMRSSLAKKRINKGPWRKILSDVDDTLFSSGGRYPAGIDTSYKRKAFYPGVTQFYKELDLGTQGAEAERGEWPPNRFGDLVFLSARPHVYKDLTETSMYAKFRKFMKTQGLHCMPSLLPGDLESGQAFMMSGDFRPMAVKKMRNFSEYYSIYPEFSHVFIGDNGQADVKAAELMVDKFGRGVVERVFIHEVQPRQFTYGYEAGVSEDRWQRYGIVFCKTYVGAAIHAAVAAEQLHAHSWAWAGLPPAPPRGGGEQHRRPLILRQGLRRVAEAAREEFLRLRHTWKDPHERDIRRLELNLDLEAASRFVQQAGLPDVRPIPGQQEFPKGALVYSGFGRGYVRGFRQSDGLYEVVLDWGAGAAQPPRLFTVVHGLYKSDKQLREVQKVMQASSSEQRQQQHEHLQLQQLRLQQQQLLAAKREQARPDEPEPGQAILEEADPRVLLSGDVTTVPLSTPARPLQPAPRQRALRSSRASSVSSAGSARSDLSWQSSLSSTGRISLQYALGTGSDAGRSSRHGTPGRVHPSDPKSYQNDLAGGGAPLPRSAAGPQFTPSAPSAFAPFGFFSPAIAFSGEKPAVGQARPPTAPGSASRRRAPSEGSDVVETAHDAKSVEATTAGQPPQQAPPQQLLLMLQQQQQLWQQQQQQLWQQQQTSRPPSRQGSGDSYTLLAAASPPRGPPSPSLSASVASLAGSAVAIPPLALPSSQGHRNAIVEDVLELGATVSTPFGPGVVLCFRERDAIYEIICERAALTMFVPEVSLVMWNSRLFQDRASAMVRQGSYPRRLFGVLKKLFVGDEEGQEERERAAGKAAAAAALKPGTVVKTAFGRGVVDAFRPGDRFYEVRMVWGARAYLREKDVSMDKDATTLSAAETAEAMARSASPLQKAKEFGTQVLAKIKLPFSAMGGSSATPPPSASRSLLQSQQPTAPAAAAAAAGPTIHAAGLPQPLPTPARPRPSLAEERAMLERVWRLRPGDALQVRGMGRGTLLQTREDGTLVVRLAFGATAYLAVPRLLTRAAPAATPASAFQPAAAQAARSITLTAAASSASLARTRVPLGARVLTDLGYGVVEADVNATYRVRLEGWGGSVYVPAPAPLQRSSGSAGSAKGFTSSMLSFMSPSKSSAEKKYPSTEE
jgi:hypothetical protein